jgi:hypothetical protein
MITLMRSEEVELYQVQLTLKVKTKQSPFIAILIFAQEQKEIDAISVKANLLDALPERACNNLLKRLTQQGYLVEYTHGYLSSYRLTELGETSAKDRSFWIGEKGIYKAFVSKSNLVQQKIIRLEKAVSSEDQRYNSLIHTPLDIRQYEGQIITLNNSDTLIEDIEPQCLLLKPVGYRLEIVANEAEVVLKFCKENQTLFKTNLEGNELLIREQLLTTCEEIEYNEDKNAVLVEFNKDELTFKRKVKINKPSFKRIQFNPVELENVAHIPSNKSNATLWLNELLYKGINQHFLSELAFNDFAARIAEPILKHEKVKIPSKKEFVKLLAVRDDAFYQLAKLETIDYLNY